MGHWQWTWDSTPIPVFSIGETDCKQLTDNLLTLSAAHGGGRHGGQAVSGNAPTAILAPELNSLRRWTKHSESPLWEPCPKMKTSGKENVPKLHCIRVCEFKDAVGGNCWLKMLRVSVLKWSTTILLQRSARSHGLTQKLTEPRSQPNLNQDGPNPMQIGHRSFPEALLMSTHIRTGWLLPRRCKRAAWTWARP